MTFLDFQTFKKTKNFNKENYDLGIKEETKLLPTLKLFFKDPLIHSLPEGDVFDFKGERKVIELKSRTNFSYSFKDTAIGLNKLRAARKSGYDVYFVFKFIDQIMYWKYDPSVVLRGGLIFNVAHCFIPIKNLTTINIKDVELF